MSSAAVPSTDEAHAYKGNEFPLLLKDFEKLMVRSGHYTPIPTAGHAPLRRPIKDYLNYGKP